MKKTFLLIICIGLIFFIDRYSKNYVKSNYEKNESIEIIGDHVKLTFITNDGIAFGLFQNFGHIFLVLAPLSLLLIVFYFIKYEKKCYWTYISFTVIIGGAIGNVYDRIFYGAVIDFIDVNIPDINLRFFHLHRWPVFNVADFAISTGIIIYIIYTLFFQEKINYEQEK